MSETYNNSVFSVEIEKIRPNPFQPRREFDPNALEALAESIRQYGVLQPLLVTRHEVEKPEGGIAVEYELIAGERRLRASKIAGLKLIPALIRSGEESGKMKLEMAIIENLQREDLNSVDRGEAFKKLHNDFGYSHAEIGRKIGKSREYVSNSIRILGLPEEILDALKSGKLNEGQTRPLLMISGKPEEQMNLYQEMLIRKITVRDAESIARRIAVDRVRKSRLIPSEEVLELEKKLTERLGTRVRIEKKGDGGHVLIDYYSPDDLQAILEKLAEHKSDVAPVVPPTEEMVQATPEIKEAVTPKSNAPVQEKEDDSSLYSVSGFSV